jgi:D-alanyl-D-alanine carboxypeptidase
MRICSTSRAVIGQRDMRNHNRLLNSLPGCVGMKTGYTRAAGRTLVSCVQRDGHRLVAVTLQDGNDWADHETLYTMGFELLNEMRETT